MPTYTTKCGFCEAAGDIRLSYAEYDTVKAGTSAIECQCGKHADIVFNPGEVDFVLKDGISGGWQSKALKENKYRAAHREVMAKREADHVFKSRLIPNYKGQETSSWKEAQSEAAEARRKEGGAQAAQASASTYQPFVGKELK